MKRYDLEDVPRCGERWREMIESPDGDWVNYDDVAAIEAERDRLRVGIAQLASGIYGIGVSHVITEESLQALDGFYRGALLALLEVKP